MSTPLANVVLPNPPPHNALCSLSARRGSRASLPSRVVSGTFSVVSERLHVLRLFAACVRLRDLKQGVPRARGVPAAFSTPVRHSPLSRTPPRALSWRLTRLSRPNPTSPLRSRPSETRHRLAPVCPSPLATPPPLTDDFVLWLSVRPPPRLASLRSGLSSRTGDSPRSCPLVYSP